MVRTLQFAAVRAFLMRGGGQRVVRTAHVALGLGGFLLWNSHLLLLSTWCRENEPPVVTEKMGLSKGQEKAVPFPPAAP